MTTSACGCTTEATPFGIRSVAKCRNHAAKFREPSELTLAYYEELGSLKNGEPVTANYVAEFLDGFGPVPIPTDSRLCAELGCGISPYVDLLQSAGWVYKGYDASPAAVAWLQTRYCAEAAEVADIQNPPLNGPLGLVLSAHAFEHIPDPSAAAAAVYTALEPGGYLLLLVPDDSDLCNPDHLWFWNRVTLKRLLLSRGFSVERLEMRRRVAHENFIYCVARKPND